MSFTLLLPVLNEVDGLKAILPEIDRSLFDSVIMIDGCSTDGSVEYALAQGLTVVTQLRKGLQFAVLDVMEVIDTDYVVEFSMDGNCEAKHLAPLVAKLREGYDLVIVSRYLPPAKSLDDNRITAFGNWAFSFAISMLGPTRISDSLGMYRGYRSSVVMNDEFKLLLRGPTLEPLTSAYANMKRMRIAEIPGDEPLRIGGQSKMSIIRNGSACALVVLRCWLLKWGLLKVHKPVSK